MLSVCISSTINQSGAETAKKTEDAEVEQSGIVRALFSQAVADEVVEAVEFVTLVKEKQVASSFPWEGKKEPSSSIVLAVLETLYFGDLVWIRGDIT
ncbi:unnamed protein product [Calypogeia fissa]